MKPGIIPTPEEMEKQRARNTPERKAAWEEIMRLAEEHDLIGFSYGGVAILDYWKDDK